MGMVAYVNWSVFTALTTTLFYFSVWELALTGSELSLLATVSPIVLGIPGLRDVLSTRAGRATLHVLTISGLAAYLLDSPVYRLLVVAFASSTMSIGLAIDWTVPLPSIGYQGIGGSTRPNTMLSLQNGCSYRAWPPCTLHFEACQPFEQPK